MKFLYLTIFLFCAQVTIAQNLQTNSISGTVTDREDSSPVQFAYLYLKNNSDFSALADEQGEFKFFFPSRLSNETVVISCLGYEQREILISSLAKNGNKIQLQSQSLSLNEITVMPEHQSLQKMISTAIDNIPKNYPDIRHQLRGFYRKVSTDYDEFTKLVEAAVVIEDVSYLKDGAALKIKLESLRQSDELGEIDSATFLMKQRIREQIKSRGGAPAPLNEIIGIYHYNGFRGNAYNSKTFFGKDGNRFMGIPELPTYHRYIGEELIGNDTIYHIAVSNIDPPNGSSYLKINSRNHAIVEYQISYQSGEFLLFAKFKEVDGKYYPEMMRSKNLRIINRDLGPHQMDISTFWFDMPITENFKKIKARDAMERDQEVESNKYNWDEEYWKNYDFIRNYPLDSAIIRSLERKTSLEQQFKKNGND